jgi:GT2 family glycosyltransferase
VPSSRIVHLEGKATGITQAKKRRPGYWFESRRRYFVKYFGVWGLLLADLFWAVGRMTYMARLCLRLARGSSDDPPRFALDLIIGDLKAVLEGTAGAAATRVGLAQSGLAGASPCLNLGVKAVGVVIIGRNEGERLVRCIESVLSANVIVVYVDSGSDDGSIERARSLGADVVELDSSVPFTAARARNRGLERLVQLKPDVQVVQFIDGDCELASDWLTRAVEEFAGNGNAAVVAGRLRERHPEASVYNRLCDMEWETEVGEVGSVGGIAMYRVDRFCAAGRFNEAVAAGEEPELCARLRANGWRVIRLADGMGWHDAAMTRFGQWWKRAIRSGHAYAEGMALQGSGPTRHNVKDVLSILAWGVALPLVALALAWPTRGLSLLLLALYGMLWYRVRRHRMRMGNGRRDAGVYAIFTVIGKFAEALGVWRYIWRRRILRRGAQLIEHKRPAAIPAMRQSVS